MPQIAGLFEEPVFPYVVRLGAGQHGVLVRYWPEVAVDTSRHFSYALQWFSMAIAVVIVSLILSSNLIGLLQGKPES
jgi:surfeit locus 1 family protein